VWLSVEQYVRDLLQQRPSEGDWAGVASAAASLGDVLGERSIGEKAWQAFNEMEQEIAELSRSRGDSGDPRVIHSARAELNELLESAKAQLLETLPGIDQPGFTKLYPKRAWPTKAFGKTKHYGL
jgi:hypothetical protein